MTIKKRWEHRIPFTNIRFTRSKTLNPGYHERVVLHTVDDGYQHDISFEVDLKVHSEDEVSLGRDHETDVPRFTVQEFGKLFRGEVEDSSQLKEAPSEHIYEKDDVNKYMVVSNRDELHERRRLADGLIRSISGRKIDIIWEQTLPPQARK